MATYFARKTGNINAADVWATTPSGTAAAVTFASGDVLLANSFAITVNVDTNLGATGQVRNDTTGGATGGGGFILASGVTLTASIYQFSTNGNCCIFNSASPASATIIAATIVGGNGNSAAVDNTSSGTLNINVSGTVGNGLGTAGVGVRNSSTGTINLTTSGGIFGGNGGSAYGVSNTGTGAIYITGNATGGTHPVTPHGVHNNTSGTIELIGIATGGISSGVGANNSGGGTLRVTKAVGNGFGPGTSGLTSTPGVSNSSANGIVTVEQIEFGSLGQSPTSGAVRLVASGSNNANFYATIGERKTLIDATANASMPAASDVRSGVSYASGALTGSCAVPAAGSVALGVPVDTTTGTAVLTIANVQSALTDQGLTSARAGNLDNLDATVSSRLAPSGTLATVTTLTNAPSVPTPAQIATQVRTELGTELGRLDAAVSSRLAPSGTLATVTTLTNAPSVPSAATIASQVRTELTTELARIDAPVSGAAAPTASTVATAVRTELATELARVDAAISTRSTPANIPSSDITAIKAKTDALVTDRLAQCSTVATTGAQLAAALS